MAFYLIGIGGTGAKCVEAIVQVAAVGLFIEEPIRVLFVDSDVTNGNLNRAINSLRIYQSCYGLLGDSLLWDEKQQYPWMKTRIKSFSPYVWSPFGNTVVNRNLSSFFNYNNFKENNPALGNFFDVLYTKDEREVPLDVGFRGRPAIGSAIMSQVNL